MNPELKDAFRQARYEVLEPKFEFKIGEVSTGLNRLLEQYRRRTFAFITPFNPGSQVIPDSDNEERFQSFNKAVSKYVTFEGYGGGQAEGWPLERSLLILGISLSSAKRLGRRFGQDAIVFGFRNKPPEIVVLSEQGV